MGLRIREDQSAIFAGVDRRRFAGKLAEYLTTNYPHAIQDRDPAHLHDAILTAIECAETYGLSRRLDVRSFVAMYFCIGAGFHLHPPIHAVLAGNEIPPNGKIDVLIETIPVSEWEKAASRGGA
jgi:hypothetical protein